MTKYSSFWICLVLTLATVAVYYQVCSYDFVNYNDPGYLDFMDIAQFNSQQTG